MGSTTRRPVRNYFDKCRNCECLEGCTCKHPNAKKGNDIPVYYRKGKVFKCPKQEKLYLYIYCLTKGTLSRWPQDVKEVAPESGSVSYYTDEAHQHWKWVEADSLNRIKPWKYANNITIRGLEDEDYTMLVYTWSCDDAKTVMGCITKWMTDQIEEAKSVLATMSKYADVAQMKLEDIKRKDS